MADQLIDCIKSINQSKIVTLTVLGQKPVHFLTL